MAHWFHDYVTVTLYTGVTISQDNGVTVYGYIDVTVFLYICVTVLELLCNCVSLVSDVMWVRSTVPSLIQS